jgi:PTH1 family peptidyl-tRNA hydrolase
VGLGNPGPQYRGTRHNAGADFIEVLSRRHRISLDVAKYRSLTGRGEIAGLPCLLALPQTYMNLSGQAVKRLLSFTNTPVSSLVVAHDDLDLPNGTIRLRAGGGAGGHRGVASLIDHLQDPGFVRLKIGIGRPPPGRDAEGFVLGKFTFAERALVAGAIDKGVLAMEMLLTEGIDKAMSLFNRS